MSETQEQKVPDVLLDVYYKCRACKLSFVMATESITVGTHWINCPLCGLGVGSLEKHENGSMLQRTP